MNLNWKDIYKISNIMTLTRLFLVIPIFILLKDLQSDDSIKWILFGIIFIAGLTDYLDGFFARKFDQITELGKLIDPLSDKLLVGIIIFRLYELEIINSYLFWIIISRDLFIFIGGIIVSKKLDRILPSNKLGKLTVFVIGIFILLIIGGFNNTFYLYHIYELMIVILCVLSFFAYAYRVFEIFKWEKV